MSRIGNTAVIIANALLQRNLDFEVEVNVALVGGGGGEVTSTFVYFCRNHTQEKFATSLIGTLATGAVLATEGLPATANLLRTRNSSRDERNSSGSQTERLT
jgi:hypothetical protein